MGTIRKDLFDIQKTIDAAASDLKQPDASKKTIPSSKGSAEGKVTAMRHRAMSGKKPSPLPYLSPLKNGDITKLKTQVGGNVPQDLSVTPVGVSKGNPYGIHTANPSAKPQWQNLNPQNLDKPTEYIKPGMGTLASNISLLAKTATTVPKMWKEGVEESLTNPTPSEKKTMIKTPHNQPQRIKPPKNPYRKP